MLLELLRTNEGVLRLVEDRLTDSYSIGLRTTSGTHWKCVSKELHDLLIRELNEQEGNR